MILIYAHISSPRLQYICRFIFTELIGTEFAITVDSEEFSSYDGVKVNYSNKMIDPVELQVPDCGLLFEQGIKEQAIECFTGNYYKAFFRMDIVGFYFDIFAASFYLITRYEEYLPHLQDKYGRYDHENSLAFKENFLNYPLINLWAKELAENLQLKFPGFKTQYPAFKFIPTYDIDIAYSYLYKGLVRNIAGFIRTPSMERIKVLLGIIRDPFDNFAWLDELHKEISCDPVYFFLLAAKRGTYDKNIAPASNAMWKLVKIHAKKYCVGIHPSWQSGDDLLLLKKEKVYLEAITEKTITRSRQHYIRFQFPVTFRRLITAGIKDDYSMGYGSTNGFRASSASSFYWYDLEREEETDLRIHPFCFMDANSYFEQHLTPQEASAELNHYSTICKEVNGQLITVWHNNFLGTAHEFKGWKEIYEAFMQQITTQ